MGALMSPGISMAMSVTGWASDARIPAKKIMAAIERCEGQGISLCYGDHGVSASLLGGWQQDRRAIFGVNLVGAVVLAFQPEAAEHEAHPDPMLAAALALQVPAAYVHGMVDGWERAVQSETWLSNVHRSHYLNGYEAGMEGRFTATTLCDCGTRRFRSEPECPSCEATS